MQQLSGLDNSFLLLEAGGQHGHIASYIVFDTGELDAAAFYEAVRETFEERLHLLPPYRRRLVSVPLDLDRPYWIEDPDFDLDFHLRHIAVPAPGDIYQQTALIARIHSRPLDRSKPLWEVYVIDGLENGLTALYSKIHHCTIDGVSGAQLTEKLLDHGPKHDHVPPPEKRWIPDRMPTTAELTARGVLGAATQPGRTARAVYRTARAVWESNELLGAAARNTGLDKLPLTRSYLQRRGDEVDADPVPQTPAPRTPWNHSITPNRCFAYFSHSLADYKRVKSAFGTTLNDVVLAVTSASLRRYLEARGELPHDPLKAMVPVSVRTEAEADEYTNKVSSIITELATDEKDPVKRLRRIHDAMVRAKRMQEATPASLLQDWTEFATPALFAQAARIAARTKVMDRLNPPFNVIVSNVPGPREPLYLAGAEMKGFYPVSAVADGQGLNVTVMSYRDHLDYGLVSCRELLPELWDFEAHFAESLAELVRAAEATGAESGGSAKGKPRKPRKKAAKKKSAGSKAVAKKGAAAKSRND